jgi:7-cyano-7-deazaguanine synthase
MVEKEKVVIILSGGLDSTTLLYYLHQCNDLDVFALSFDYGQKHAKELKMAKMTCRQLNIRHQLVDLSDIGSLFVSSLTDPETQVPEGHYAAENMKSTVVPNRNMIMLSIAMGWAFSIGAKKIYCAVHSGDHAIYPDCRPEFIKAINDIAKVAHYTECTILAPYLFMTKGDIVKEGLKMAVDYSKTWTCYKGHDKACGVCGSCTERLEAFKQNGAVDPLLYEGD